jgi:SHS2 domain-containing protein
VNRGGAEARGHGSVAHTADVGLQATAPDLPALFEEAALALSEIAADVLDRGDPASPSEPAHASVRIVLAAPDLPALAFGWLNELIGLADARRAALVSTRIEAINDPPGAASAADEELWTPRDWTLEAVARFAPFGSSVRPRLGVKSATYHGLDVRSGERGWSMTAYLDV